MSWLADCCTAGCSPAPVSEIIRAMPERSQPPGGGPHDVLAAEEFGVGVADPRLHLEPPHDVLAAEAYALPAPDPILHPPGPVRLPEDPAGRAQPRDVLAAEEYALPAPPPHEDRDRLDRAPQPPRRRPLLGAAALGLLVALRRRRRGRRRRA
jgi:hypothetical protein